MTQTLHLFLRVGGNTMSENSTHLVFSYGTLKRSERNFSVMSTAGKGTSSFVGSGETVSKYPLVVGTKFNIPFMINMENQGHNIVGEIFEIDDQMLEFLDEFEGHPNWYRRQSIPIRMSTGPDDKPLKSLTTQNCWAYFLHKVEKDMLEKEWLREFRDETPDTSPLSERLKRKDEIENEMYNNSNSAH